MLDKNSLPEPLPERLWLSSPTMHGEELEYVRRAYETNWMSTVGENVDEVERLAAEACGRASPAARRRCTWPSSWRGCAPATRCCAPT